MAAVAIFLGTSLSASGEPVGAVIDMPRNTAVPAGPEAIDITPDMLGPRELAVREAAALLGAEIATGAMPMGESAIIGEEHIISVTDIGLGTTYDEHFVVVMQGEHGILLVEKAAWDAYDPITEEYVFANPNGCWRDEDRISVAQLSYLLEEFDTVIYPTTTQVFGDNLARGAEGQKIWTLIHNIRDESYYNCDVDSFVVGYFSASENAENNKNLMHIDSYDWANLVGPGVARPHQYEGTFAHELEHLKHFDQDADEPSWVDEGLADMARFLCGYGHSSSHIANYLVLHPMVSLTFWGGDLENYGASYLFQLYLFEHYGGVDFTSALTQEQSNGIEGIENALVALGHDISFDEIFDDWTVANYVDDTRKSQGKYGYETLDMGSPDTRGYTIEYALTNFWWGPPTRGAFDVSSDWFFGMEPLPYTAHYFRFNDVQGVKAYIDGQDFAGVGAFSGTYEWYSDAEVWAHRSFFQTFDIPAGGATLNFMTWFAIEDDWDYGYVEVYDRDTGEWTTLDAPGTVDYVAYAQDNPNTPPGRQPFEYALLGRWHAFTGSSGGWLPVTMDLSPFAGHAIDLYFTTWQDGAFTLQMMYVDDISIPEIGFFDDVESGANGWQSTGWYVTDGILDNGFGMVVLDTKWVPGTSYPAPAGSQAMPLHTVEFVTVDPDTQMGAGEAMDVPLASERVGVGIVSNHAEHIQSAHYELSVH